MNHELKILIWEITDACNLSCRHCYKKMISSSSAEYIDGIDIVSIVFEFQQCGLKDIVISGGEPLLKKLKEVIYEKVNDFRWFTVCTPCYQGGT